MSTILTACSSRSIDDIPFYQPGNSSQFDRKYELQEVKEVVLQLDTLIGFRNNSVYFFRSNGKEYLSVLNAIGKSIYFFDYPTGSIVKKIPLSSDGPNGVGKIDNANSMHFVKSWDSVYFINSWTGSIYHLDSSGKIVSKKELGPSALRNWVTVSAQSNFQIPVTGDYIYLRFHPKHLDTLSLTNLPCLLRFNLRTGESKYVLNYPRIYDHGYWGGNPFKYLPGVCFAKDSSKFIVSYPIDPLVYTYDSAFNLESRNYVASEFFKEIDPMETDATIRIRKKRTDYTAESNYAMTHSDYNFIALDPSDSFYVRMAYVRPDLDGYKAGKYPEMSLIIFNRQFEKVGEVKMDSKIYWSSMIFTNENGLHIPKQSSYQQDESKLTFGVFKIKKINAVP